MGGSLSGHAPGLPGLSSDRSGRGVGWCGDCVVASAQSGGVLPDVPDLDNSVTVPVGRCGLLVRACALGGHQGGVWNRDLLRCRGMTARGFFIRCRRVASRRHHSGRVLRRIRRAGSGLPPRWPTAAWRLPVRLIVWCRSPSYAATRVPKSSEAISADQAYGVEHGRQPQACR